MSSKTECPNCLGTGEELQTKQTFRKCALCKGKGEVDNALAEDYITSINIINMHDDEFYNNQY
tara:strand:- start:311 stop:499 length:189 start_codon:yes stop_codon:yes gene_type:complete